MIPGRPTTLAAVAALTFTLALSTACGTSTTTAPAPATAPSSTTSGPSTPTTPTAENPPASTTPPVAATQPPAAPAPADCAETASWGTGPSTAPGSSQDALYLVRAGQHPCYDRVVFDINGPAAAGFAVHYVPVVLSDAKGDPIPVPGGATLQVVVRAPELGADNSGHAPGRVLANTGDFLVPPTQVATWASLRAVRFAGSFEGQSTFAVGVRTTLRFRTLTDLDSRNQVRHLILDIAH